MQHRNDWKCYAEREEDWFLRKGDGECIWKGHGFGQAHKLLAAKNLGHSFCWDFSALFCKSIFYHIVSGLYEEWVLITVGGKHSGCDMSAAAAYCLFRSSLYTSRICLCFKTATLFQRKAKGAGFCPQRGRFPARMNWLSGKCVWGHRAWLKVGNPEYISSIIYELWPRTA